MHVVRNLSQKSPTSALDFCEPYLVENTQTEFFGTCRANASSPAYPLMSVHRTNQTHGPRRRPREGGARLSPTRESMRMVRRCAPRDDSKKRACAGEAGTPDEEPERTRMPGWIKYVGLGCSSHNSSGGPVNDLRVRLTERTLQTCSLWTTKPTTLLFDDATSSVRSDQLGRN